jgi:hypothetical protein
MAEADIAQLQAKLVELQKELDARKEKESGARRPCLRVELDEEASDVASVLAPGTVSFEDPPAWFTQLFPGGNCAYRFPPGVEKDGRLTGAPDETLALLQAKSSDQLFRAFAAEWRVLRQSIVYQLLQAQVTVQVLDALDLLAEKNSGKQVLASANLADRFTQLEQLQVNLLGDQLRRASVILTALHKDVPTANRLHHQFEASALGSLHPDAWSLFREKSERASRPAARGTGKKRGGGRGGASNKPEQTRASAE